MGSPLSPIIADIVMQDLEEVAITKLQISLLFYFWYVDILLALPYDQSYTFSILCTRLQFTEDWY